MFGECLVSQALHWSLGMDCVPAPSQAEVEGLSEGDHAGWRGEPVELPELRAVKEGDVPIPSQRPPSALSPHGAPGQEYLPMGQ